MPFSILYDLITRFRNYLFDIGYKRSFQFQTNVIAVGNLSVGGTGKTPMIEYLIRLLEQKYKLTTLSRGYGRKTKGFRIANDADDATTLGDEPYQFFRKFDDVNVTVGEQRALAIPFILAELPETDIILLDDAYQHRYVSPGLNILLTDFNKPFFNDHVLPSGRLREARKGASRADIIVVTKCDTSLDQQMMSEVSSQISEYNNSADIYFSSIQYHEPIAVYTNDSWSDNVLLFSGIADNRRLRSYVSDKYNLIETVTFKDHHNYSQQDIDDLKAKFERIDGKDKCILTTEKDMVKLLNSHLVQRFDSLPVFYLPIRFNFLKDGKRFDETVLNSINSYSN